MSGIIDHGSYIYGHGIVSQNCFAKHYSDAGIAVKLVCSGTFVQVHSIRGDDVLFCIVRDDMQVEMNQMICKKADIINVPENLWGPLFPVKKVTRLSLVRDRKLAESIGNIAVGHVVQVLGPDNSVICTAKVTFRNSILRLGVGIYFGLQVMSPRENLQTITEKVSLLGPGTKGFPRGCDIVVSIDRILPSNHNLGRDKTVHSFDRECRKLLKDLSNGDHGGDDEDDDDDDNDDDDDDYDDYDYNDRDNGESFKSTPTSTQKQANASKNDKRINHLETHLSHSCFKKTVNSDNPLKVGDEVIYLDGETPKKGVVKWMGLIENSLKVEVEFDNPIGCVLGNVDSGGDLFKAKNKHTLIVSAMALIKSTDYLINNSKESIHFNNNNINENNNYKISKSNSNNSSNNSANDCLKSNYSMRNINNNSSCNNMNNNNSNSNINKNNNSNSSNSNGVSVSSASGRGNSNSNISSCDKSDDHCRSNQFSSAVKQNVEDIYKKVKKVSDLHQCLKHPAKNLEMSDCLWADNKNDTFCGENFLKSSHKSSGTSGQGWQSISKSFDYSEPSERKINYKRHCNSVDNSLLQKETNLNLNIQNPKSAPFLNHSSLDLCDAVGPKQEKTHWGNSCTVKKLERSFDCGNEGIGFYESASAYSAEKNLKVTDEKDVWGTQHSEHSSSEENLANYCNPSKSSHLPGFFPDDLGKGSVVELIFKGEPHFGVIRWIGTLPEERENCPPRLIAGIEMEEEYPGFTDGTFNNKRYFQCNPKKALFVPLNKCKKDSRFLEESQQQSLSSKINYGQKDCPVVEGTIPPINRKCDIESICGKNRGIQGHHNSCYLDATLFSMFAFTSVFDSLLYRPPTKNDIPQYSEVQRVLREEIVNPLRKNLYVRADRVMKLRTLLEKLSSVSGLTSEEKDPEEFLNSLLAQILKAEPFLKLSSGQEAFHYQLFVEKDERLVLPSVQQLFEQSFVTSDIKLKQVPSCLIIQMPRFGKSFKMYSRILPPQLLDITDIIENSPRQCTVCGKLAEYECKDCFGQQGIGNGLESISFCKTCLDTAHNHHCRSRHNSRELTVPVEFYELQEHCIIPRLYMELFAVVCIETSHYVAFVKCGSGSDAPWCFFDSMADRKGEQNGYNIPEMVPCPDLPYWLSEEGAKMLNEMRDERQLTEHAKRLFSDAYMCMYQSPDLMMYR